MDENFKQLIDELKQEIIEEAVIAGHKRILEGIEKLKEEVQQDTGSFKYDDIFDQVTNLLNNPK